VIDFRELGIAIDDFQEPSTSGGPSNPDHQPDSTMHCMATRNPDYPTSNDSPTNGNPGAFDLWTPQGQQQQPAGSMPIPMHVSRHRPSSEDLNSSASSSHVTSSLSVNTAWMHDGQTFPDQPSSDIYTSSPWLMALQAPPIDENDHGEQSQHIDRSTVDHLDLQDGGTALHGWAPS
jgi:hypothetical protein